MLSRCALILVLLGPLFGTGSIQPLNPADLSARPALSIDVKPLVQYRGVDASFVPWFEGAGVEYFDEAGVARDPIELFATRGANLLRIRVFVDPPNGHNGLDDMLALAQRGTAAGMDLLIDLHYSDTWADPGQQSTPSAWAGLDAAGLTGRVRTYARDVVAALYAQGTPPTIVQIGNEVIDGMLWPIGRISTGGWGGFASLLNAGIAGVADATPPGTPTLDRPKIMIHIDRGANLPACIWFYDNLAARGVVFDMIGLSYYPWWHGPLSTMRDTIRGVGDRYRKPVMLVETAYPWTLAWDDNTHNFIGEPGQLLPGYDATPSGQRAFLETLTMELRGVDGGRGIGWCYWAPAFVAARGTNGVPGSPWENQCLFDFEHKLLEGARAF